VKERALGEPPEGGDSVRPDQVPLQVEAQSQLPTGPESVMSQVFGVFAAFEAGGCKDVQGSMARLRAIRASAAEAFPAALQGCAAAALASGHESRAVDAAAELFAVVAVEQESEDRQTGRLLVWVVTQLGGANGAAAPRDKSARRMGAEILWRLLPAALATTSKSLRPVLVVAETVLLRLSMDRAPAVRLSSARGLGELLPGSAPARGALERLATSDVSAPVRSAAVDALGSVIGGVASAAASRSLDASQQVRRGLCAALCDSAVASAAPADFLRRGACDMNAGVRRACERMALAWLQRSARASGDDSNALLQMLEAVLPSPFAATGATSTILRDERAAELLVRACIDCQRWRTAAEAEASRFARAEAGAFDANCPYRRARALVWRVIDTEAQRCEDGDFGVSSRIVTEAVVLIRRALPTNSGDAAIGGYSTAAAKDYELRQLLQALLLRLQLAAPEDSHVLLGLAADVLRLAPLGEPRESLTHALGSRSAVAAAASSSVPALAVMLARRVLELPLCAWSAAPTEARFAEMILGVLCDLWRGGVGTECVEGAVAHQGMEVLGQRFDEQIDGLQSPDATAGDDAAVALLSREVQAVTHRALRIIEAVLSKTRLLEADEVGPPGANLLQEWLHPTLVRADVAEPLLGGKGWPSLRSLAVRCMALQVPLREQLAPPGDQGEWDGACNKDLLFFSSVLARYGPVATEVAPGTEAADAVEDVIETCVLFLTDAMLLSKVSYDFGNGFFKALAVILGPPVGQGAVASAEGAAPPERQSVGGSATAPGGTVTGPAAAVATTLPGRLSGGLRQRLAERLARFLLCGGAWAGTSSSPVDCDAALLEEEEKEKEKEEEEEEDEEEKKQMGEEGVAATALGSGSATTAAHPGAKWCLAWLMLEAFYRLPPTVVAAPKRGQVAGADGTRVEGPRAADSAALEQVGAGGATVEGPQTADCARLEEAAAWAQHRGRLVCMLGCLARASVPHAELCAAAGEVLLSTELWRLGADGPSFHGSRRWRTVQLPRLFCLLARQLGTASSEGTGCSSESRTRGGVRLLRAWLECLWRPMALLCLEERKPEASPLPEVLAATVGVVTSVPGGQAPLLAWAGPSWAATAVEVARTLRQISARWAGASGAQGGAVSANASGMVAPRAAASASASRALSRFEEATGAVLAAAQENLGDDADADAWRKGAETRRARLRIELAALGVDAKALVQTAAEVVKVRARPSRTLFVQREAVRQRHQSREGSARQPGCGAGQRGSAAHAVTAPRPARARAKRRRGAVVSDDDSDAEHMFGGS